MQDLVRVLGERLHLHAGHPVIEPPELLVPGRGRCGGVTLEPQASEARAPTLPTLWPPYQALRFEAWSGCP